MLMIVCIQLWCHFSAVRGSTFGFVQRYRVENSRQLDFEFVGPIKLKGVVEPILIIRRSDDLRDDQSPVSCRNYISITIVGMLVQETVVFLMDANSIGNDSG